MKLEGYKNLVLFSPSGALLNEASFDRGVQQLQQLGYAIHCLPQVRSRQQRFAGSDLERIHAIDAVCHMASPSVLMASRGGYGLSRLLGQLKLPELLNALCNKAHILCGHSDFTALQLALLAEYCRTESLQAPNTRLRMLHGPMVCFDFGAEQGADSETARYFELATQQNSVNVVWDSVRACPHWASSTLVGPVWGGNLVMLCSVLGTPYFPMIQGGILILEDVNEPVYKIERMLFQLLHAGVLQQQLAIVMGNFTEPPPIAHDEGYNLTSAVAAIQAYVDVPILMDFPFGHCTPKACWFQGQTAQLTLQSMEGGGLHCTLQQQLL